MPFSIKIFSIKEDVEGRTFTSPTTISLQRDNRYIIHWAAGLPEETLTLQEAISKVLAAYGFLRPRKSLLKDVLFDDLQARETLCL